MDEKRKIVENYLIEQGFFLNDGIKYGLDFLVYTDDPNKVHSKYGVLVYDSMHFQELVAYQRICCSNNKILVIAIVDENKEIRLFECRRFEMKGAIKKKISSDTEQSKRFKVDVEVV